MRKLTKTEANILQHRLDAPDAIWDALQEEPLTDKEIYSAIESVAVMVAGREIGGVLTYPERAVLLDLVDGSTYVDALEGGVGFPDGVTAQYHGRIKKIFEKLEEDIRDLCGEA